MLGWLMDYIFGKNLIGVKCWFSRTEGQCAGCMDLETGSTCVKKFAESFSSESNSLFFGSAAFCFPVLASCHGAKVRDLGSIYVHIRMECMICN